MRESNVAIETLEGIIPICMHCKQIGDDQGHWNKLETFISSHAGGQFPDSTCDSCLAEHYPIVKNDP